MNDFVGSDLICKFRAVSRDNAQMPPEWEVVSLELLGIRVGGVREYVKQLILAPKELDLLSGFSARIQTELVKSNEMPDQIELSKLTFKIKRLAFPDGFLHQVFIDLDGEHFASMWLDRPERLRRDQLS